MYRILGEGERITKKDHECYLCGKIMVKGTKVGWQTNTGFDGADFGTVYWHIPDCPNGSDHE